MSSLSIAIASAVEAGAATLPAWRRALEWYSASLLTDPVKTKGLTSMFVNPIGGMVGQIMKDGKITNWHEIKWFIVWGLGLGASLSHPARPRTRRTRRTALSRSGLRGGALLGLSGVARCWG